jgi:hypothetical protein
VQGLRIGGTSEKLRHRAIGLAAFRNGADPHFHQGPAVGKGLDTVNSIAAATRGYPERDTDSLCGMTPRIGH